MDYATALTKIKKCLALSRSSNEHEAAAALRQAQKLMQEHGISDTALQLSDVSKHRSPMRSQAVPQWEAALANAVADAFGCMLIMESGFFLAPAPKQHKKNYVFIGVAGAAQVASYAHDVLARQCAKARQAHVAAQPKSCKQSTKTGRGDAFAKAWVYAVVDKLDRFANGERNTALLAAYKAQHYPSLGTVKPKSRDLTTNVKGDSYRAGFSAGRQADLKRSVSGCKQQELLS